MKAWKRWIEFSCRIEFHSKYIICAALRRAALKAFSSWSKLVDNSERRNTSSTNSFRRSFTLYDYFWGRSDTSNSRSCHVSFIQPFSIDADLFLAQNLGILLKTAHDLLTVVKPGYSGNILSKFLGCNMVSRKNILFCHGVHHHMRIL